MRNAPKPDEVKWTRDPANGKLTSDPIRPVIPKGFAGSIVSREALSEMARIVSVEINKELGDGAAIAANGVVTIADSDAFQAKYPEANIVQKESGQVR